MIGLSLNEGQIGHLLLAIELGQAAIDQAIAGIAEGDYKKAAELLTTRLKLSHLKDYLTAKKEGN